MKYSELFHLPVIQLSRTVTFLIYTVPLEIQSVLPYSCVLSDSSGRLWYLHPPNLQEILLPSSQGGHGVFAVQMKEGQAEGKVIFSTEVHVACYIYTRLGIT